MLTLDELSVLLEKIEERIILANRNETLFALLERAGFSDLLPGYIDDFYSYPEGKIVVIGDSEVYQQHLEAVARGLGLGKERFEFCLDYDKTRAFNFRKLQYDPKYRLVMVGPMPHKTSGTGDAGSAIAQMKQAKGYPKVVELRAGNKLKITKQAFTAALRELLNSGFLTA